MVSRLDILHFAHGACEAWLNPDLRVRLTQIRRLHPTTLPLQNEHFVPAAVVRMTFRTSNIVSSCSMLREVTYVRLTNRLSVPADVGSPDR